jgi:F420-non-reducing hydrogenase iron-sulfur subunit
MRLQYADNVRIVAIPCTGKADVKFLLTALENGADGVMVAGCLEGDCHYLTGNLRARKRVERVKKILAEIGFEPERVEIYNLSAGQGPRFAAIVNEFTEQIAGLGPLFPNKADAGPEKTSTEIQT